jgi:hypothetical protein
MERLGQDKSLSGPDVTLLMADGMMVLNCDVINDLIQAFQRKVWFGNSTKIQGTMLSRKSCRCLWGQGSHISLNINIWGANEMKCRRKLELPRNILVVGLLCNIQGLLTGLPGVLHHSINLRTLTPGYIAERACREELLDLAYTIVQIYDNVLLLEATSPLRARWRNSLQSLSF